MCTQLFRMQKVIYNCMLGNYLWAAFHKLKIWMTLFASIQEARQRCLSSMYQEHWTLAPDSVQFVFYADNALKWCGTYKADCTDSGHAVRICYNQPTWKKKLEGSHQRQLNKTLQIQTHQRAAWGVQSEGAGRCRQRPCHCRSPLWRTAEIQLFTMTCLQSQNKEQVNWEPGTNVKTKWRKLELLPRGGLPLPTNQVTFTSMSVQIYIIYVWRL